jgi:hypothetical protein
MTRDAKLLSQIFEITRGDLDSARFPFPQSDNLFDSLNLLRIIRLARFWKHKESDERFLLGHSVEDLVSGFYGQNCPFAFLLMGSSHEISCWFGASRMASDKSAIKSSLRSAFPDIRLAEKISFNSAIPNRLNYALLITGTPSPATVEGEDKIGDQIEKVCRGLYGHNWVYVIYAQPLPVLEVARSINQLANQIRETHSVYLLKGSPTDEKNRLAQRYVELLEAKLKRFEHGRTYGMWEAQTFLMCDNLALLGHAQGLLHSAFAGEKSHPDPIRARPCDRSVSQGPPIEPLNTREVAILARPPHEAYPGYEIVDYVRFGVEAKEISRLPGKSILIGQIVDRGRDTGNSLVVTSRDLTKHGLIAGVTGSGKTNTCFLLLDQIWDGGHGVPFLVIESAKSEYRTLLREARFKGLHIFTVGDERISPLRLNPFEVPRGILVQTHIDYLKSLFSAAFVLYPPMPYVLEQSIQEVYQDRGWDLASNSNWRGEDTLRLFPTLTDLVRKIGVVVDRMGYDEQVTMTVKAGLLARLNQLRLGGGKGLMLNTRNSLPPEVLFETPCILELKQLVSDDEKAFLMGLILIRLYEHYEAQGTPGTTDLKHITLIEEAHRLLRNVSTEQGSEVSANPRGRAIEVFANIISEIRAYGEGILIAEQIPVKLTPDAIKNTNLKIIHRLVSEDDRKTIGNTMNMTDAQMRFLSTLHSGEAVAFVEGMQKSVILNIDLSHAKNTSQEMPNGEVRIAIGPFWQRHKELKWFSTGCAKCPYIDSISECNFRDLLIRDPLSLASFKRLFNTLRLNRALVIDSFGDFKLLCQRNSFLKQRGLIYCALNQLTEVEIESRGEFHGWLYADVDQAVNLITSILAVLSEKFGKVERKSLEKEYARELTALSQLFKRLHRTEILPFPGCRFCSDPCHYRYDMQRSYEDPQSRDFREDFLNKDIELKIIARLCWNLSIQSFWAKDIRSRRGAALCFAIQQFSDMGLSSFNQDQMTQEIYEYIQRQG